MNKIKKVKRIPLKKLPSINPKDSYWIDSYNNHSTYYDITSLLDGGNYDWEEFSINAKYANEKTKREIYFSSDPMQFCCGTIELGELSNKVLTDKDMDTLFIKLFENLKSRTVVITTIKSQIAWETYLTKTKLFQAVKSFVNPSTKRTITLWVSTN